MYEKAVDNNDDRMIKFCNAVFDAYDKYGYNGHIQRPNSNRDKSSHYEQTSHFASKSHFISKASLRTKLLISDKEVEIPVPEEVYKKIKDKRISIVPE